jgi:hypothetical protein
LEREIYKVTPAKCKLFDKLFERYERQLLQEVEPKVTGSRRKLAKDLALVKAAAEVKAYGVGKMTADKRPQF